jgi:membrane protein implicated in regulation of membrane protease activity
MTTVYLFCAVLGCGILVVLFVIELLGLGGDSAADATPGGTETVEVLDEVQASGADSTWLFQVLSFRALVAAVGFFGLGGGLGASAGLPLLGSFVLGVVVGGAAMVAVAYLSAVLLRLQDDGTVREGACIGLEGEVYLPVPGGDAGQGKVLVVVQGRTMEYAAVTAEDAMPAGTRVVVVGVAPTGTVSVKRVEA